MNTKTKTLTKKEIKRDWYIVDATNVRLGKLATAVATKLIGKSKATFSTNFDNGDHVVILNSKEVSVHPKKLIGKIYYRHSGYIGGLNKKTLQEMMEQKPNEVIRLAVKGMLPRNKIGATMLRRLYIYEGAENPHDAQKPIKIEIANS